MALSEPAHSAFDRLEEMKAQQLEEVVCTSVVEPGAGLFD